LAAGSHVGPEIPFAVPVDQIPPAIALVCGKHGNISLDGGFEYIEISADLPYFLAFSELRSNSRARIEAAEAGGAGSNPFAQRPLRNQFKLNLAGGIQTIEHRGTSSDTR